MTSEQADNLIFEATQGLALLSQSASYSISNDGKGLSKLLGTNNIAIYQRRVAKIPTRIPTTSSSQKWWGRDSWEFANDHEMVTFHFYFALKMNENLIKITDEFRVGSDEFGHLSLALRLKNLFQILEQRRGQEFSIQDLKLLQSIHHLANHYRQQPICALCPRLCRPHSQYCEHHTFSKIGSGSAADKMRRNREGQRVITRFEETNPQFRSILRDKASEPYAWVARVLWHTPLPNEQRSVQTIIRTINQNPILNELTEIDINSVISANIESLLREKIDPHEYQLGAWVPKLKYLASWLSIRDDLKIRPKRKPAKISHLSKQVHLLKQAGYSHKQIAEKIGKTTKTVQRHLKKWTE
ncbi:MAG: helix-turn-helix domain-containing protein [Proteobacteria bacterium]|nr:helix-turn-helix domain-containing protein [Pseudomonadota bacterium]